MREAGFGEEEVAKWESSGGMTMGRERERGVEDVRWRAKGEEREWDAGKKEKEKEEEVAAIVGNQDGESRGRDEVEGGDNGQHRMGPRMRKGDVQILEDAWNPKRMGKSGGLVGEMRRALG